MEPHRTKKKNNLLKPVTLFSSTFEGKRHEKDKQIVGLIKPLYIPKVPGI